MRELYLRIAVSDTGENFAPKARAIENVRFIDRKQLSAAALCDFEGNMSDALNLPFAVGHRVGRAPGTGRSVGRTSPEVNSTQQLADDHDVGSANHFRTQRRH